MLNRLFDRNKPDIARFNFGQATIDLGNPSLLHIALPAQACENMISQQDAFFRRGLQCFGFEGSELGRHGNLRGRGYQKMLQHLRAKRPTRH